MEELSFESPPESDSEVIGKGERAAPDRDDATNPIEISPDE